MTETYINKYPFQSISLILLNTPIDSSLLNDKPVLCSCSQENQEICHRLKKEIIPGTPECIRFTVNHLQTYNSSQLRIITA